VRLPDDLVEFVDQVVEHGRAGSRAEVVTRVLDRERRRLLATEDVAILAGPGDDPGFDELAAFSARTSLDDIE